MRLHKHVRRHWRRWPYKHTTMLAIGIGLLIFLLDTAIVTAFFRYLESLSYLGAFIAGGLYASAFTAAAGIVILFQIGADVNVFVAAALAALGSIIVDYVILRYFDDNLAKEFKILAYRAKLKPFLRTMNRRTFRPILRFLGVIIIASPLPDEAGLAMLDVAKLSKLRILVIAYLSNYLGVFLVLYAGQVSATSA